MPIFVLVHSPLVGPFTWALVADVLKKRGIEVAVPVLRNDQYEHRTGIPYWKQHALVVKNALASYPLDRSLILVGHSGAGPLLPVFAAWPDTPCSYIQFSPVYDDPAREAQQRGWPYRRFEAGHFHMLVDPLAVADALLEIMA